MSDFAVNTRRLRLRQWKDADRAPFAALNADPRVMEFFPSVRSRETSDTAVDGYMATIAAGGFSNWAVEVLETGTFIGFVGLSVPQRALPCMPCVEIGWRLAAEQWGQGYASEAARCALALGFDHYGLEEIVSFTALVNRRSRAVMERIGMVNANEDFEHPALPVGHHLRRHCLYRITPPGANPA
ncbi:GNAT family N-acetyltransferase [Piscinibacter terrae]|uniref:N-acetyltransferase n=1 Tax=Piscinibacter terrae TaxID=2496871 RepID=A0A3N7JWS9_9BURK|nr:GNAT family N-acetyltransferase [Albitalea terrae]RQP25279.1 N-acetyltransferase [Albitalea terrae]